MPVSNDWHFYVLTPSMLKSPGTLWNRIAWYAHLEGVTLPGPGGETEDDSQ